MLGPLAEQQLAAWETIAIEWFRHRMRLDMNVWRCTKCQRGIYLAADDSGIGYHYTDPQVLALKVLHLRNYHADLDPDKPRKSGD